jgi:cytochrome c
VKKLLATLAALFVFAAPAFADDPRASQSDAEALVKNAVAYLKRHGTEKAFKEFQNKNGPFVYRDLYVVVLDTNGLVRAHGANLSFVGQNQLGLKDPDGKEYVRERIEMARANPTGSQVFKRKNPATGQIEIRKFYYEKVDDLIVGSGSFTRLEK